MVEWNGATTMDYGIHRPVASLSLASMQSMVNSNVYNWKPSNTKRFRAALGKAIAGVATCNVICIGESTTAGQGTTSTNSAYPARMRDALIQMGVPSGGTGQSFPSHADPSLFDANITGLTGSWIRGRLVTQTAVAGQTFTYTGTGTTIEIVSSNFGTGQFSYSIDGGGAVTVTANSTSTIRYTTITGLANTSHTVLITSVGTNLVYLYSVEARQTSGLIVSNYGASGARTDEFDSAEFHRSGSALVGKPQRDLILFGCGINDLAAGTSVEAYKAGMKASVQRWLPASDVVLTTSSPASGAWTQGQFDAYTQALYELATELDIPLFDVYAQFGNYTDANTTGLMFDTYHPNANYYALRGRHHAQAVLA